MGEAEDERQGPNVYVISLPVSNVLNMKGSLISDSTALLTYYSLIGQLHLNIVFSIHKAFNESINTAAIGNPRTFYDQASLFVGNLPRVHHVILHN